MAVKKVAWMAVLVAGCGSPAFVGGFSEVDEDGGVDAPVQHDVVRSDAAAEQKEEDTGAVVDAAPEIDPCESCEAPEHGKAVCVDGECGFECPAVCTKIADGCDCPPAQCCDDVQCGGVACNRGQCSGTYTTCDEPRCWAWCTSCMGKKGGHCPPLLPTLEVFCECDE